MWPILQTAIAATAAWYAAVLLLPDGRPSFASIAAVICLGASYGQRGSKALQLVGGRGARDLRGVGDRRADRRRARCRSG